MDVIGLQELGGFANLSLPWTTMDCQLDGSWTFYISSPPLSFRASAVGLPSRLVPFVDHVKPLCCGVSVTLKLDGCKQFIISAHLPHRQRQDCIEVWNSFSQELEHLLRHRRISDSVVLLIDSNYELGPPERIVDPNSIDERGFLASSWIQQYGLTHTQPPVYTWSNQRGSSSKIDFVLVGGGSILSEKVFEDSDHVLGCDHRAVYASFPVWGPSRKPKRLRRQDHNKCGRWRVNAPKLLAEASALADQLVCSEADLTTQHLEQLSNTCSFRPPSLRYKDPQYILTLINQRRRLRGAESRNHGQRDHGSS